MSSVIIIIGRALLASLFILAGIAKISDPKPFLAHMSEHRVSKVFLPLVILLELGAGISLFIGWQMPLAAGALSIFCIATAFVFHFNFKNKAERTLFIKDIALSGALMMIAAIQLQS